MTNRKNVYLDDNELVLYFRDGIYRVMEKYEYWKDVFVGHYEDCLKYMKRRELEYLMQKQDT